MSRLIEVPLSAGGSITVEVDEPTGGRTMRGGDRGADLVERGGRTLEESLGTIAPALQEVLDKLRGVSTELSQIEVELGLKLTGGSGHGGRASGSGGQLPRARALAASAGR